MFHCTPTILSLLLSLSLPSPYSFHCLFWGYERGGVHYFVPVCKERQGGRGRGGENRLGENKAMKTIDAVGEIQCSRDEWVGGHQVDPIGKEKRKGESRGRGGSNNTLS